MPPTPAGSKRHKERIARERGEFPVFKREQIGSVTTTSGGEQSAAVAAFSIIDREASATFDGDPVEFVFTLPFGARFTVRIEAGGE